ncbi:hypothetical protein OIA45_48565 (plasmid) [Streptomyces chartreusis]|uniref:DUF6197 family protein n=1 Tax=Streptomyces chartreusis TaxID=1969 RepID=UPI0038707AF8|nr:hypothetical protein OIA45_48565 [Streptomyces chartreusis]
MSLTRPIDNRPRTAPPSAAPRRATPVRRPAPAPLPVPTNAPDWPSRWHLLIPAGFRNSLEALGLWQNPTPLIPSDHLTQTLNVLERYGWARSLDFSPTGRMCIRGAQTLLERTGHVTPASRARAVDYMQQTLQEHGHHQPFFHWNDYQEREFQHVKALITTSSHAARSNGE